MYWIMLIVAGFLEAGWATFLRISDGFSKFWPSFWTVVLMFISMTLLSISARHIPIGTSYVIWTGIGAVSTTIVGIYLFDESIEIWRLLFISLIIIGIVGLHIIENKLHIRVK